MHIKCHVYDIPGVANIRDLGGYAAKDGRVTDKGRFIRSTALDKLNREGQEELQKLGIECVIDLRSSEERLRYPDVIEKTMHYVHVPMLDYIQSSFASGDFSMFPSSMSAMYKEFLERSADEVKAVFTLFADDRFKRYLFHCTAGKDRTGVTAALLLGLVGVDDETVIEDYSYTEVLMGFDPITVYPDLPDYLFRSKPETMRDTLDYINEKYGGARGYLSHIGIGSDMREKIIKKLFGEE